MQPNAYHHLKHKLSTLWSATTSKFCIKTRPGKEVREEESFGSSLYELDEEALIKEIEIRYRRDVDDQSSKSFHMNPLSSKDIDSNQFKYSIDKM